MVTLSPLAVFGLLSLVSQVLARQPVKIMPFGASIVTRCWRANLQAKLRNAGITDFNFVGTQKSAGCGGTNDQEHEGHPGSQATEHAAKGNLTGWLDANAPDIVVMFLGTNDVLLGKKPVDEILAAYDTMLAQMRAKNPKVQIVFSNLTPLDPARWGQAEADGIEALNAAIKTYAPGKSTRGSPVYFVDNFGGFDPVADTDDGEHPNVEGNEKIASKFIESTSTAIEAARAADVASTKRVSVQARRVLAVEGVK